MELGYVSELMLMIIKVKEISIKNNLLINLFD